MPRNPSSNRTTSSNRTAASSRTAASTRTLVGASFAPTDLSNLSLWLKADSLSLNDGDPVSTWTDSSGNSNNATQTGTNRPLYKTNIFGSMPALLFDGSNDFMSITSSASLRTGAADFTVYMVTKLNNASMNGSLMYHRDFGTGYGWTNYIPGGQTLRMFTKSDGGSSTVNSTANICTGTGKYITTKYVYGSVPGWIIRVNGTEGESIGADNNFNTSLDSTDNLDIGGTTDIGYYAGGYIAELLLYKTNHTAGNITSVESYLATRWGL